MITTFMEAHFLEQLAFIASTVAVVLWIALMRLKLRDIRENVENGPIRFMLNDNRTFGIVLLSLSIGSLIVSIGALKMPPDKYDYVVMTQSYFTMLFVFLAACAFCVIACYRFRRRHKLPILIAEYKKMMEAKEAAQAAALPGGSRKNDPPANMEGVNADGNYGYANHRSDPAT